MISGKTAFVLKDAKNVEVSIKAVVSTKYGDKLYPIESMDVVSDFNSGYADSVSLILNIPLGDIKYEIQTFKEDLNITIFMTILNQTYKKIFLAVVDKFPPTLDKEEIRHLTKKDLDQQISPIQFQLMDFSILALRSSSSNGMFVKCTVEQVLSSILKTDSVDVSSLMDRPPLDILLAKPHNTRVYDHIDLGSLKRITKLPEFIQERYGVYRTGLNLYKPAFEGIHEHKDNLFVYPPLEANNENNGLIIHVVNQPMLGAVEESYSFKEESHHILVTSSIPIDDDNSKHYTSGINKSTHAPSLVMFGKPKVKKPKDSLVNESNLSIDKSMGETSVQHILTPFGDVEHTDNQFKLTSKMLVNDLSIVQVKWSNSLVNIIRPCMGCIMSYENKQREGFVIASHTIITPTKSTTVLTIAMRKEIKEPNGSDTPTVSKKIL